MALTKRARDLADKIRRDIEDGVYAVGDRLPGDKDLADEGWASTGTVRAAYRQLEAEGRVTVKHGSGRYVRDLRVVSIPLSRYSQAGGVDGLGPWEAATRAQGLDGKMLFISVSTMEAPVTVAEKLALSEADQYRVTRRTRHALIGDEVLQVQQAWYPARVAQRCGLDREGKVAGGTLPILNAEYPIALGTERVGYRRATTDEASTFQLAAGSSVARVERLLVDESGMPLELLQIAAVPDRVEFVYDGLDFPGLL
ncbi:GntR family transcriptional regulator [Kitasatospora sp. NPDC003701]